MARTIAYVLSRFPKVTETFVLYEILEIQRLGSRVEVFSLMQERDGVRHPEAESLAGRACYPRRDLAGVLRAQARWLRGDPRRYLRAWAQAVRGNARSPKFLLRALAIVPAAAYFADAMKRSGIDHVHAHFATHAALAAHLVHLLTDLPYSFTAHAHDLYVDRSMLGEKIAGARFVVTISDFNRDLIGRLYGDQARAKTVVIRSGVALERFPAGELDGAGRPFTLVCIAALEEKKGHPFLIDALGALADRGADFRCLLVGEGDEREAIADRIAARGLRDRVELLGAQPRERVVELLHAADALVLPSVIPPSGKMEGLPVALIEGMAMARPVVATRISGIPELVRDGHNGLLVPERDAPALSAAIGRLMEDRELGARLGRAGRATVEADYDLGRNVARLHQLFADGADPA